MTDTRILPDLQCSLLCEEIRQEANGNPMLFGILGQLVVPQLSVTAFKLVWDGLNKARLKVARSVLNALVPLIEKDSSKEDPYKKKK